MKKSNLLLVFACWIGLLASCKKEDTTAVQNVSAVSYTDLHYGADNQQVMDVYLPAGRNSAQTKVMILIHGGAWALGDKSDFTPFVDSLKKRLPDYAIFNINYRLSANPANLFPTQENDVKAAFEFIHTNENAYLISNKYVLLGASAGAHLSMLQGYKYDAPLKPKAIVSYCGPSDLLDLYNNPYNGNTLHSFVLANVIGKTPAQDPAIYYNSSPVNFINSSSPPTILFHGGHDTLVNHSQSVAVQQLLQTNGVAAEYYFYPNEGHVPWGDSTYTNSFEKLTTFLQLHVQ